MPSSDVIVHTFLQQDVMGTACGCPICCVGKQPSFEAPDEPWPKQLKDCKLEKEVKQFLEDTAEAFRATGFPPLPCMCCCCCMLGLPICLYIGCGAKRNKKVLESIDEFNRKTKETGLYLEVNRDYDLISKGQTTQPKHGPQIMYTPGIDLRMNAAKREAYCSKKKIPFSPPQDAKYSSALMDNASVVPMVVGNQTGHAVVINQPGATHPNSVY